MINKIGANDKASRVYSKKKNTSNKSNIQQNLKKDKIELNTGSNKAGVYRKPNRLNAAHINAVKAEAQRINENLRNLVESIILKQGKYTIIVLSDEAFTESDYSVETVSDNIVNFAIAISGNDTGKFEELKAAIEKGFGGTLPDICYKTRDIIMQKLESWKNGKY